MYGNVTLSLMVYADEMKSHIQMLSTMDHGWPRAGTHGMSTGVNEFSLMPRSTLPFSHCGDSSLYPVSVAADLRVASLRKLLSVTRTCFLWLWMWGVT